MPDIILPYEPIVITDTTDLPRDEWLAYRKTGIGGSDVAAILGISPFGTARDIYYDKLSIASFYDDEANKYQKKIGTCWKMSWLRCSQKSQDTVSSKSGKCSAAVSILLCLRM